MKVNMEEGKFEVELDAFLKACKESGNQAYAEFKAVLKRLENPATRGEARRFLAAVEGRLKQLGVRDADMMRNYNFRMHELILNDTDANAREDFSADPFSAAADASADGGPAPRRQVARRRLKLLEMSSIFAPEDWSFTFYEGILRHPDAGFRGRHVAELGCGNGWISIALAERCSPAKVYGLDINPRAIKIAWMNLYLNALQADGTPVTDHEGKSLLDRVEFHVSDLLGHISDRQIALDRVIGCIPQVLSPDPEATLSLVSEHMSEEFLHSLSNYCGHQGFVEDQFGLGLIARAVEEAIAVLKPNGVLILNMGGRPGQAVCERLFTRRGFHITKLWQTRVAQAADTDIQALVEIERKSRHRFEFFMGPAGSEEPVSARTAYLYAARGGPIAHGLTVYQCRLLQTQHPGYGDTRSALDLAFDSPAVADEKLAFLAHLAGTLQHDVAPGVAVVEGIFRQHMAGFLRLYFRVPLTPQSIVVVPTRAVAIENILRLYAPPLALVDASFARWLPKKWLSALPSESTPVVLEAPARTDLLVHLARTLQPSLMIVSLPDFEMRSQTAFTQLLEVSAEIGARLFVDISQHLELSSMPPTNGVLQYLSERALPPHAAVICGLVKNQVYSDLEVAFVVSENEDVLRAVASAGEATHGSAAASMQELFYGCLLRQLLSFQIPHRHTMSQRLPQREDDAFKRQFLPITAAAASAFQHPAIESIHGSQVASPGAATPSNLNPSNPLFWLQLLLAQFGLAPRNVQEVVIGDGHASLFARLMDTCRDEGSTAVFPWGTPGSFLATAKFFGVATKVVPTEAADLFKITPDKLSAALANETRPWVVLSAPLAGPTCSLYSPAELHRLLDTCRNAGARVVLDTCFSGLEFAEQEGRGGFDLESKISPPPAPPPRQNGAVGAASADSGSGSSSSGFAVAILGGISNRFSAGGLKFGYLALRDAVFIDAFREVAGSSKPHGTLRYAVKRILGLLNQGAEPLASELAAQRKMLAERGRELAAVLAESGWEPLQPQGGVFVLARPAKYEGVNYTPSVPQTNGDSSTVGGAETEKERANAELTSAPSSTLAAPATAPVPAPALAQTLTLSGDNVAQALYDATGLVIDSSAQIGIPDYCRFSTYLEEEKFASALQCIRRFHTLVFQ
eukprot:jgi/Mesen1/747/ME000110S_11011